VVNSSARDHRAHFFISGAAFVVVPEVKAAQRRVRDLPVVTGWIGTIRSSRGHGRNALFLVLGTSPFQGAE